MKLNQCSLSACWLLGLKLIVCLLLESPFKGEMSNPIHGSHHGSYDAGM